MSDIVLRRRHRLKAKEVKAISEAIHRSLGVRVFETDDVDIADAGGWEALLVKDSIMAFIKDGTPFLTLKGIMLYNPEKGYLEVDEGAVRFLANGADVMSPGVVNIHPEVKEGEWVFVRDAKYKKPLCVGVLLLPHSEILTMRKGKCVKTFHYVGDSIWKYGEEKKEIPEK